MDISKQLDPLTKTHLPDLLVESKVLDKLLREKQSALQAATREAVKGIVNNLDQYNLIMNPSTDQWELRLKTETLVLPGMNPELNRVARRAMGRN